MSKDLQLILKIIYDLRKSAYFQVGICSVYKKPTDKVISSYLRSLDFHLDRLFSKFNLLEEFTFDFEVKNEEIDKYYSDLPDIEVLNEEII